MSQYDENGTMKAEQEAIRKSEQQRIDKERMAEEKRLADERQQTYEKNREQIRKDSERRRQQDKDRKEFAKHQEDVRIHREEIIRAEKLHQEQEQGEEVKPMQSRTPQSQELRDLANTQKAFERQIKVNSHIQAEYQRTIDNHDHFKGKFEEWQKVNRSIEQTKDRATLQKLHAKRDGIEKEIEKGHKVGREKPKFFDGKGRRAELDKKYEEKLQDKMQQLTNRRDEAVKGLSEDKDNDKQGYKEYENSIHEKVQQRMQEQADKSHTHSLGRGR